jgi:hypothetical protein
MDGGESPPDLGRSDAEGMCLRLPRQLGPQRLAGAAYHAGEHDQVLRPPDQGLVGGMAQGGFPRPAPMFEPVGVARLAAPLAARGP